MSCVGRSFLNWRVYNFGKGEYIGCIKGLSNGLPFLVMPSAVIEAVSDSITSHVVFRKCCVFSDPITHFDLLRSAVVKSISKSRGDYFNTIKIERFVGENWSFVALQWFRRLSLY